MLAQTAFKPGKRLTALVLCFCLKQIAQAFDFDQIEFAVFKCPTGELASFGQASPLGCQELEDSAYTGWRTMHLQFRAIFAGKTVRCWKIGD